MPEFEEVVFSLEVGETSGLVRSDFGYHIIRLLGRETRPLHPALLKEIREQTFEAWVDAQREAADVEILVTFAPQES